MSIDLVLTVLASLVALWAVWKFLKWVMKIAFTLVIVVAAFGYLWQSGHLDGLIDQARGSVSTPAPAPPSARHHRP